MDQMFRHKIAIAPMIDITYEHFRVFMRLITKHSTLYTEMIHENAINNSIIRQPPCPIVLEYSDIEHPLVCQLGGNNHEKLAQAAKLCEQVGYDEVNLNVGCPSERVQDGAFGACLMKEPHLVADIMKSLRNSVTIPCTVKCRLGVDDFDSYEFARDFVEIVHKEGGVTHFIVHARKAFLKGLNPSQNRSIPPLNYEYVYQLKKDFPQTTFTLNGGIKTHEQIQEVLKYVDGVMIGRLAYDNPWWFRDVDSRYYNVPDQNLSRRDVLLKYSDWVEYKRSTGCKVSTQQCVKPIINLFNGENHNKKYRQFLSITENHGKFNSFKGLIEELVRNMEEWNKEALYIKSSDYQQ